MAATAEARCTNSSAVARFVGARQFGELFAQALEPVQVTGERRVVVVHTVRGIPLRLGEPGLSCRRNGPVVGSPASLGGQARPEFPSLLACAALLRPVSVDSQAVRIAMV